MQDGKIMLDKSISDVLLHTGEKRISKAIAQILKVNNHEQDI
jgi:hypothetical protein